MQLEAANLIKPKPTKDNYTQTTGIKVSHVSVMPFLHDQIFYP